MARKIRDPGAPARIVEAAWRVVAGHGIRAATMRAIAVEAGVTTGFITHYFADKQELIAEVLRYNNARALRRISRAIGTRRGLAAVEAAVEAVLPVDGERRREWQVWVASWAQTSVGGDLAAGLSGGWRGLRLLLAELLGQALGAGELRDDVSVDYEAQRLLTMVAGAGLLAGVEAPTRVRREARRMLADHLALLRRPTDAEGRAA
jgi:AcrR family transcriptional regulator